MASLKVRLLFAFLVITLNIVRTFMSTCNGEASQNGVCVDTGQCKSADIFYILPPISRQTAKPKELVYQVVIDAGSTGSRIHVFTFRRTSAGEGLILENTDFDEIEPGLSYYLNKPEEGVYSVKGLLQQALKFVPKSEWHSTPVSLRATAGLRLLPDLVAGNIMKQVRKVLMLSPFKTLNDFISIMDGDDEGIFAWTTLNFLTDNLNKQLSFGALDLGGGSTQIVFKPMSQETILKSPESHLNTVKILGSQYDLYSYSYLGLGLMSARQAVLDFTTSLVGNVNAVGNIGNVSTNPCIQPTYEGVWSFSGKKIMIHGNSSFGYENCLHYVKQIVSKVHQPAEIVDRDFYAFSYYYDTAIVLGLIAPNVGGPLSLQRYLNAAKKVCSEEGKEMLLDNPFLCLDAVYITTLLRNGFGFQETQIFQVTRKINNVELSWALGAALHMLHDF